MSKEIKTLRHKGINSHDKEKIKKRVKCYIKDREWDHDKETNSVRGSNAVKDKETERRR